MFQACITAQWPKSGTFQKCGVLDPNCADMIISISHTARNGLCL
nr:MAG TPA: hypothetical protein [Caudoviricetes sp.]